MPFYSAKKLFDLEQGRGLIVKKEKLRMTVNELRTTYHIPTEIIEKYESLKPNKRDASENGKQQYDDRDLEKLSMLMTLYDIGLEDKQVDMYMQLDQQETNTRYMCMQMLTERRKQTLQLIHEQERKLEELDYLRYIVDQQMKKTK